MNNANNTFSKWAKYPSNQIIAGKTKQALIYTRVSSKEQADKNLSLDFQKKIIDEYANKNDFTILNYFGGTYESAKTDGRKEFGRMLEFIKKNKGKITHILVYTLDRFSRTGGGAIKLAQDLREKYGVSVFAVTQPTDTSNASGVFQQNIHLLFSEFDNQLRKQRAVAGMKEKFERGIWCLKPPMGYDIIRTNGERKIVVNKEGKQIKKAFIWKSEGMKNEEILGKLKLLGLTIYKQKLSMIFSNPFYCGIISNKMLDGKLVEGQHEKVIPQELFLQVNKIRESANKFGVPHRKESCEVPLKVFMKCEICGEGYTGYIVKAKNLWYYKCRTIGCCCNKNAKVVNNEFVEFLHGFSIKQEFIEPILFEMNHLFDNQNSNQKEELKAIENKLKEVEVNMDRIEKKFFIKEEMPKETFEKFMKDMKAEKDSLLEVQQICKSSSSNLKEYFSSILTFSSKLTMVWASSDAKAKENLQKLIFPDGVRYNKEKGSFRTEKVNMVFNQIASVVDVSDDNKNRKGGVNSTLSMLVGMARFELATSWSQTRRDNRATLHPELKKLS
jgi:site-specific DNA recombinase